MSEKRSASDHQGSQPKRIVTHSPGSAMNALRNSVLEALEESRMAEAISLATTALQELQANTIDMLELRAKAWSKKANSGEELKDALTMIQVAPGHANGYLCASKLYSMQGYQGVAIETLEKGLNHISPSDTGYLEIRHDHEKAKARSQRRVDFIANCPYDIVPFIVNNIADDTIVESTMVSRTWHTRILQCQTRWRAFQVGNFRNRVYHLLPAVSHHIVELKLVAHPLFLAKCFRLMQRRVYPRLRSLEIEGNGCAPDQVYRFSSDFCGTLPSISGTLTHLHIADISTGLPPLAAILAICRNLSKVYVKNAGSDPVWLSGLSLPHTTLLTHLTLSTSFRELSASDLEPLLRCSPALTYLELTHCNVEILLPIERYSRNLTHLLLNPSGIYQEFYKVLDLPLGSLQYLILGGDFSVNLIQTFLQAHHDTLTTLILSPEDESDIHHQEWNSLSNCSFPALTKLYIKLFESGFGTIVPVLIRQCPSVISMRFELLQESIASQVFDALAQLKHLKYLYIFESIFDSSGSSLPLMLKESALKVLEIADCYGLTDETLIAAASITSLETLWFGCDCAQITCAAVLEFTCLLGELPRLSTLYLDDMELCDVAIQNLCNSKSLKTVELSGCSISENGLLMLRECSMNVKIDRNKR
ncbi:hypothetical protein BJV82DRAFT_634849 [Fennellomyces sp. T-0311]|nr:hypothetical protein BJV82DRAFT_634849 [Fennellomyces sp. T-0311]